MADLIVLARAAVAVTASVGLLAACGGSSDETGSGFSTGEELHAALADNGIDCQGYVPYKPGTHILGDATDGGRCHYDGATGSC